MANEIDHISLANKNHATLLHLLKSPGEHLEWVVTIAFYKAVHVVEAAFAAKLNVHSISHSNRRSRLKNPPFQTIFTDFEHLFTASRIARYLEDSGTASKYKKFSDFLTMEDAKKMLRKRLYGVEQKSLQFLTSDGKASLKKFQPNDCA